MDDEFEVYQPSRGDQILLTILFLPSGVLSLIGSGLIVRNVLKDKKKTSYRRLMLGLSISDLVSTIVYMSLPFLGPRDHVFAYVFAIGNHVTCNILGAMVQLSWSTHLYAAGLALYFVSTVRYGVQSATFAKRFEPWIHGLTWIFCITTALAGFFLDVYYQRRITAGCWVSNPPICEGINCQSEMIAWIMGGLPLLGSLLFIFICNMLLYCYVRKTVYEGQKKALAAEKKLMAYRQKEPPVGEQEEEDDSPPRSQRLSSMALSVTSNTAGSVLRSSRNESERVRQVGIQSFLYVTVHLLTFSWSTTINILNGRDFEEANENAGKIFFPLLVMQSIFIPLQGFFNSGIFFRPRYNRIRLKFYEEDRWWCMRRTVLGDQVKPTVNTEQVGLSLNNNSNFTFAPACHKRVSFSGEIISNYSNDSLPSLPQSVTIPNEDQVAKTDDSAEEKIDSTVENEAREKNNEPTRAVRVKERQHSCC